MMKASIRFNYSNYSQLDDCVTFFLVIQDDDGKVIFDNCIGDTEIPKSIAYFRETSSLYPEIVKELLLSQITMINYWEE